MPRRGSRFVAGRATNPMAARFREIERAIRRRQGLGGAVTSGAGGIAPVGGGSAASLERSASVVSEQTYGQLADPGSSDAYSAGDHTHGTPDAPATIGEFDAIVDFTAGATDTETAPPLFLGIGEACAYLWDTLALESANILVRNHNGASSGNSVYTETANFNSPAAVHLFGLRGGEGVATLNQGDTGIAWDLNGFRPICDSGIMGDDRPDFYIHNFNDVDVGQRAARQFRGLFCYNVKTVASGSASVGEVCTNMTLLLSGLDVINSQTIASAVFVAVQSDVAIRSLSGAGGTFVLGGSHMKMVGCNAGIGGGSSGTHTLTLPNSFDIDFDGVAVNSETRLGLTLGGNLNMTVPASARGKIDTGRLNSGDLTAASAVEELSIKGRYDDISIAAYNRLVIDDVICDELTVANPTSGEPPANISAICTGNIDLGQSVIDISHEGSGSTVTFRGRVAGVINSQMLRSSGNYINLINADATAVMIAYDEANATGTAAPYSIDAATRDAVLIFHGHTLWPVAGTDSGTNNRILPEGSAPFSVNGHVIEDEGTPLAQRANVNFVGAGVTATDSAPDTVVTIPGVGTPTAGWGSITNVTTDRVMDADSTTLDEVADLLGTLIADLVSQGVLAS